MRSITDVYKDYIINLLIHKGWVSLQQPNNRDCYVKGKLKIYFLNEAIGSTPILSLQDERNNVLLQGEYDKISKTLFMYLITN